LLFCLLTVCTFSTAQQSQYAKQWEEVDEFELQGQIASALKVVNDIRQSSKRNDKSAYVKSSVLRWKFLRVTTENAENTILQELNQAIEEAQPVDQALFYAIKGKLLKDYSSANSYKINNRSQVETRTNDITEWSNVDLRQEIAKSFGKVLQHKEQLLQTPAGDIASLLDVSLVSRQYRPTVYDILAQEVMGYYTSHYHGRARTDNTTIFKSSEVFRATDFKDQEASFSKSNAITLLQEIEAAHMNDIDQTAFVFAQLERLKYARVNRITHTNDDTSELYESGLITLSRKHKNIPINGLIQYRLADFYMTKVPYRYVKDQDATMLTYYKKAENLCKEIIVNYPNSEATKKASRLLKIINAPSLSVSTKSHTLSGSANRMLVNYRNVDSLQLQLFKLPSNIASSKINFTSKELIDLVNSNKNTIKEELFLLPNAEDKNPHTTEFLLPVLEYGHYLIYLTNNRLEATQSYAYAQVEVSDFDILKTSYDEKHIYQFYDRNTGQPLIDIPVQTVSDRPALNTSGKTNKLGEYELKKPVYAYNSKDTISNNITLTAIRNRDTLYYTDHLHRYSEDDDDDDEISAKTQIYLDREIYRPGQTMYFKGILMQQEDDVSEVVANEKVVVYIEDANYDEIFEKEFTTNKFGSFSGEFKLPEDVFTGEFTIYAEEGFEESDFWDELDDYYDDEKTFKVEAYKRPTFEITFDEVKEIYKPNDSIVITGNAKAFLGSNVTDAMVDYTVKRSAYSRYSYYSSNYNNGDYVDGDDIETDEEGNFKITFEAAFEEDELDNTYQYNINVEITDLNGETRENNFSVRVGRRNIITDLQASKQVKTGQNIDIEVVNENLNGALLSCDNTLKIYRIVSSPKKLYGRLWDSPQYQKISESDFVKNFPNEPYISDEVDESEKELIYEGTFLNQSQYKASIPVDSTWQGGRYVLEQTAQDKNGVSITTEASFNVIRTADQYLPIYQLFKYEVLNENPRKDGYVELQLRTSLKNLPVFVNGLYQSDRFFAKKIDLDGNQIVKIPLKSSYEKEATVRVKYAQFDRFYSQDIKIDLSTPLEFLQVETTAFRNKLYPDSKEQWSFIIKNQNGKKAKAEVLASMYDMSLDEFAQSYWNPEMKFPDNDYYDTPYMNNYEKYSVAFNVRINEYVPRRYISTFDTFNYYGLSFVNSDYYNSKYLQRLKIKQRAARSGVDFAGNIKGIVFDREDLPLPGANIVIKGSDEGVQTNFDGEFAIAANIGDVLVFSYLGFHTQEVVVTNGGSLFINLEIDDASLDEVVVVGYGTSVKKSLTASVVQVSEQALMGKVAGVEITDISSLEEDSLDFNDVKIRRKLDETAFFFPHLMTNRKGEVKFTFDAPQLLTKWKFRLLAHSKKLLTGGIEAKAITQKDVSVVPNTPRFLREGDVVSLSAKIANLTSEELKGAAQLQLFDALTMQPIDTELSNTNATQDFTIDKYGNVSVFWELKIPLGVEAVTYRMVAKAGQFSDGEENILPVLSSRMMVTESIPFLVRAGEEETVRMNNLLNNNSTTLASQKFVLEYTSNPSWYALQSLPYLMEFPHECAEQTFSRLYANSLSAKILNSNPKIKDIYTKWKGDGVLQSALEENKSLKNILISETPWLRDAQSETERKKRLGLLFDLDKNAAAEKRAIDKLKDLQNSDGGLPWFSNGRSNYYITRHVVSGMGHLKNLGVTVESGTLLRRATLYLDQTLENRYNQYIKNEESSKEGYYGSKEIAKAIVINLRETAVQSKTNGMYWKSNQSGWYWYNAPIETQSLIIEAFEEILDDQESIKELKIWLIQQKRTSNWTTTKATTAATYALLMSGTNFLDLDDSVSFEMSTKDAQQKIENTIAEEGTGTMKVQWNKKEVTPDIAQVAIKNEGTATGYGGLFWQYVEDLDKIPASEKQVLNLSKKLYLINKKDTGAKLKEVTETTVLELGQTVRVRLIVKAQSNMEFVHLKDMRASGFEPMDVISEHKRQDGIRYYQTTKDTATHFFFDKIKQGTYIIEYDLRVNNKGSFSNGISTLQSMYAPEFSGNTAGMRVTIE